jgi:hypothetical protein
LNVSEIINSQIPDTEGNIIPAGIHEGSAEIAGSQGENEHILVSVDAGTYNVQKAPAVPIALHVMEHKIPGSPTTRSRLRLRPRIS